MALIQATIGRDVWYRPLTQELKLPEHNQPFSAKICYVHNDNLVNLHILNDMGQSFYREKVVLVEAEVQPEPSQASWMPWQISMALKNAPVVPIPAPTEPLV